MDGVCSGGGASILINRTDIGDTYQFSDDFDNDGFEDDFDNCPFVANADQADSDGDGVGNACDICASSANALQEDADSDGVGDACDDDADNDGLPNADDNCPLVANPNHDDTDSDGLGNACDGDDDNDGVPDGLDDCPLAADPSSSLCDADTDEDGVPDSIDNCVVAKNFDQADLDGDGMGDLCDADADGDGVANIRDNCAMASDMTFADADRDGRGDACDDRFCYAVSSRDVDHCLDPSLTFTVLTLPEVDVSLGDEPMLHLFANLENRVIRYNWTITRRPGSSTDAKILNARGAVGESQSFEYRYAEDKMARFVPDVAGEYELQLSGELQDGADSFGNSTSRTTIRLLVNDDGGSNASGCTCLTSPAQSASLGFFLMVAGLVVLVRRKK
ncbi:MAG: thrombospondin type 3 repeat-containing protein [Deltaproteobacteria bacterium]|nr:thrombospondin type 3 repeat-containing protein [Deltaproteobacteria bacterium]